MRSRWFVAAAVWALVYAGAYVALVGSQGDDPAPWYLMLLLVGVALSGIAGVRGDRGPVGIIALALLGAASLVALASTGMFLLPAVVLAAVGLSRRGGTPSRSRVVSPGAATSGRARPGRGSPGRRRA